MTTLSLAQIPFLDPNGNVSQPWLLYLLQQNTSQVTNSGGLTLTANALIVGNGSNDIKALTSLGQAYLTLHGNSGGLPTWATVDLTTTGPTAQVSGRLALSFFPQSTLGVIGVAGSVLTDPAYINAASDDQVLRRSGTSIAFGAVNLASASAVTGVLPAASIGAAGLTTQVQFNDAGALAGNTNLTFDKTTSLLTVTGQEIVSKISSSYGQLKINNPNAGAGSIRAALSLTNQGNEKWLIGNDSVINGTSDFFIFDSVASLVRLTIGTTGAVTVPISLTVNSLTSGRVTFAGTSGLLSDSADFTYSTATGVLTLGKNANSGPGLAVSNIDGGASASANFSAATLNGTINFQATGSGFTTFPDRGRLSASLPNGLDIYTSASAPVRIGTNSTLTDLVIDTSHNVSLANGDFTVSRASAGAVACFLRNTQAGAGAYAHMDFGNDLLFYTGQMLVTSSTYTPSQDILADACIFRANGAGGLILSTFTTLKPISFWTNTTKRFSVEGTGEIKLWGSSSGSVGLQGAAAAGSTTYTLPAADGTAGQVLKTDGAATLSWSTRLTNSAASLPAHRLIVGNTYPDVSAISSLGTKGYGLTTDGVNDPAWQDVGGLSVIIYGADPTGVADSLTAINNAITAAGSGGHVYFPPGTYKITNAIRPSSNVKLYGAGYASQISYAGTGGITIDWVNGGGSGTDYFMVLNAHGNNRSGTVDTNIEICHLRFTYASGTSPHTILFMNTTGCSVHHCYQDGGAQDLCSFLKSKYYNVHDNYSNGALNCCYDNWDGPSHGVISANVAVPGSGGSGIFINGISTNTTPTPTQNDGFNMVVCGNTLIAGATNCIQGIYIAGLSVTSTVKYVSVVGNTIKSDGGNVFSRGIDIRQGNYVTVNSNTVVGACSLNGIEIVSDYNVITGNIVNSVTGVGTYGIEVTGNYNMFSGNVLQGNATNFRDTGTGNQNTSNTQASNTINIVQ